MKKIIYLLILIPLAGFSQENSIVLDSIYGLEFTSIYDSSIYFQGYYTYDVQVRVVTHISLDYTDPESTQMPVINEKKEYQYDLQENFIITTTYQLDKYTGAWVLDTKLTTETDLDGNPLIEILYTRDTIDDQWINKNKYEYTYAWDGNDSVYLYYSYAWNKPSGSWMYVNKLENIYNQDHKRISQSFYQYDPHSMQWIGTRKEETIYNEGSISWFLVYCWDLAANNWRNTGREEYTYEPGKNTILGQGLNESSNEWENSYIYCSTIDSAERRILEEGFTWDTTLNDWIWNHKQEYGYDENGNVILTIYSTVKDVPNSLEYDSKNTALYNTENQLTTRWFYRWNRNTGEWYLVDGTEFLYDSYGHNICRSYYFAQELNQPELKSRGYYYYSLLNPDKLYPTDLTSIRFYPNPVNSILNIEIPDGRPGQGSIFGINGKLIMSFYFHEGLNTYDVSSLKSGMYLIKLPQGQIVKFEKR